MSEEQRTKKKEKRIIKRDTPEVPAPYDFEQHAGEGFEKTSSEDLPMPFINVLQTNSHQLDEEDEKYIEGAKVGQFFNIATKELFSELLVIPVAWEKKEVEWRVNRGGFVAEHLPEEAPIASREGYKKYSPDGNELVLTVHYYILYFKEDGTYDTGIIPLSSSGLDTHRQWQMAFQKIKMPSKNKRSKPFKPPIFAFHWNLTTYSKKNKKGKWKAIDFEQKDLVKDEEIINTVISFREIVSTGSVKKDYENFDQEDSSDEQVKTYEHHPDDEAF
jgi:hypothetical protein